MIKNRNAFMGAIPMIVASIAAGADVRVVWGKYPTASTDGKVIRMPFLPLEDDKVEAYALGFAVHETGHIVGTEFGLPVGEGLHASLVYILEDVRIEGERMTTLPGARRWLEALAAALLADGYLGQAKAEDGVAEKLISYLLTHLWVEVLRFKVLEGAARHCRGLLADALPAELFTKVEEKALAVRTAQSTRDVIAIADGIMALLQQEQQAAQQAADAQSQPEAEDDKDSARQGDGDGSVEHASDDGDSPAGDDGQGEGHASEESDSRPPEQSEDSPGSGAPGQGGEVDDMGADGDSAPGNDQAPDGCCSKSTDDGQVNDSGKLAGQSDQAAGGDSAGDGTQEPSCARDTGSATDDGRDTMSAQALAQALQELLDAKHVEAGKDISERIAQGLSAALDLTARVAGTGQSSKPMGAPEVAEFRATMGSQALIGQVRLQSTALRARLDEYVQVQTRRRSVAARSGSRLVREAASRLAMKDYRIYGVERSEVKKVDTAFALLVDCSSSMRGEPVAVARQAAVALAVALEDIKGTQLSVIGFGTPDVPVTRVMRFGESIRKTAGRVDTLDARGGSTPLAEGLLVAHSDLLSREAERRIVMVVTDGEPDDVEAVHEISKFGRKHGIEHMGIGIRNRTDHLFPASCFIHDVGELPRAVLDLVQRVLFDDRLAA